MQDTFAGLKPILINHYKKEIIKSLFGVIGSIEIIGNPVGLIRRVSRGIYELFEKPIEGMKEGSLELILGIFGGIGSLLKNAIAGTFTSV